MPNPVTLPHVVARYPGTLSDGQQVNAQAYIADAWALLLLKRPTLEADITAATVTNADVIRVVSTAVVRKLINPEGKSEESIDDYRFKFGGDRYGDLYFTDEELVQVTPLPTYGDTRGSVRLVAYGEV